MPPFATMRTNKKSGLAWRNPIAALVAILLLTAAAARPSGGNEISDNDILEAIETELRSDDVVSADLVDVTVEAGIVTLSGRAFTLLAKRRAARLMAMLKGVRGVVDRARVLPSGRTDVQVLADITAALRDDPAADSEEIQLKVTSGRVTLSGTVDSYPEKHLAETAVAGVRGVVDIDNQTTIVAKKNRPDKEIQPEILRRFELHPFLAAGLIEVKVLDGVVILRGSVGSAYEKGIAELLSLVAGVREVNSTELKVEPGQHRKERRRDKFTAVLNDVQLKKAVEDVLLYDPRVRNIKIDVQVRQGAVTLLGKVSSLAAKRAAQRSAENTLGVRRIINHLKVKDPDWPGDLVVTKRAQAALERDAHLAGLGLRASSHFGKVYVTGKVNTHFEQQRAEFVVANIRGALEVVNRVAVDAVWKPKPDDEIHEDVVRRLRFSPMVDEDDIEVSVEDGVVTLTGAVDTWHGRRTAGRHARQGGARRVDNKLDVRSQRSTPPGLKATLVPKQDEYTLSPERSGNIFRQFLERAKSTRDTDGLPPPPKVDLVLKLHNEGEQPVNVRLGHDRGKLELSLTGKGAVHVPLGRSFTADFRSGHVVRIKPGDEFEIPIRELQYGFRNASHRWYWTEPGEYLLQATFIWPTDVPGLNLQAVAATPVKLKVTSADE